MDGFDNKKAKRKKKRGGTKKRMTTEQVHASHSIHEWVFLGNSSSSESLVVDDDFGAMVHKSRNTLAEKLLFELHSHSICSDGYLTPLKFVERAHGNGVKVLALTDHDTMSGVPEALEAARRFGIKIIPRVEISTLFSSSAESGIEEPLHILAYYSNCGPKRFEELESFLAT